MLSTFISRAMILALIMAVFMVSVKIAAPQRISELFMQFVPYVFMFIYLLYIEYLVQEVKEVKEKLNELIRKDLKV